MKSIPFTKEGYEKLLTEQKHLYTSRPDAVAELKRAREMGDLSENGAYKGARLKLSQIDRRLRELERLIKSAKVVGSVQTDYIEIGSTVIVRNNEKEETFQIVGSFESNPQHGTISHKSPIGRALLGKKVGETITVQIPQGIVAYTILRIIA